MKEYKIIHFSSDFSMEDINKVMESKYDVLYYTREVKNELHIVNHKSGKFTITPFMSELLGYYKKNEKLATLLENTRLKGNDNFSILSNANGDIVTKIKQDLNNLLKK